MKTCKELHIIQELPRSGNIPASDGRDVINLSQPGKILLSAFNTALPRPPKSEKADLSVL
jgi:hypothetical protein